MKTAILVISFGTSHRDTLEKTIGAVEKKLKYEFKTDVFRAFTSGMIIKKLRERDGIEIDTVDKALEKLYKEDYIRAIKFMATQNGANMVNDSLF